MTARATNLSVVLPLGWEGKLPEVMFTSVEDPVLVAQTWPFVNPTIRYVSSCGEMAIVLIGDVLEIGAWLTTTIVSPRSVDR